MTARGLLVAAVSGAALVVAGPRNMRNLEAIDALAHGNRADHRDVWAACGSAAPAAPAGASLPLAVAGRRDCMTEIGAVEPRDEVDAFWIGVAESRRGRRASALAAWRAHGVSRYFLGAAVGKTPPEREVGLLFIGYLLELHSDDWEVLYRGGQQLRELAPDRASAPLLRAAALRPGNANIQAELGLVAARLSRFEDAAAHYRRARELEPSDPSILQGLGEAEYYAGRLPASLEAFLMKASLVPEDAAAQFWIARIRAESDQAAAAE